MERRRKEDIHYLMQNSFRSFFSTARTKISIQLLISGSRDSMNKRDLEEGSRGSPYPCLHGNSPSSDTYREKQAHFYDCQFSDAGWAIFLGDIHTGFRLPDMVHRKDLSASIHSGACSILPKWPYCSSRAPKNSTWRRSQALDATILATTI